jgi:nucleoside-diphosphate-sugar epimerase
MAVRPIAIPEKVQIAAAPARAATDTARVGDLGMAMDKTVLLVGGTGRTGQLVLEQLLQRGFRVRAIVRSPHKLPPSVAQDPNLTVVEADLLSMRETDLLSQVRGCHAVISCLGHVTDIQGIFRPPRDLVTQATTRLCRAIVASQSSEAVRFILMSSVSVHHPAGLDVRRGRAERAFMWTLRSLVPPSKDNQQAADFLVKHIGAVNPSVEWVVVRPDTLVDGGLSQYALHEQLVSSLFKPDKTNMANVAHFMGELVEAPRVWEAWQGKLPVIINAAASKG